MQVSVYLSEKILKRLDALAQKQNRSRSKVIETLLDESLRKPPRNAGLDALAGAWKDRRSAQEIIEEIYRDRRRNRRSDKAAL